MGRFRVRRKLIERAYIICDKGDETHYARIQAMVENDGWRCVSAGPMHVEKYRVSLTRSRYVLEREVRGDG